MQAFTGRSASGWMVFSALLLGCCVARGDEREATLAAKLVERAGFQRGVCAVLGRDGEVAVELARASQWLVYVREPQSGAASELRQAGDEAKLGIDRLVVERGGLNRLPHTDNMLDAVIATSASAELLQTLPAGEVLRALRPGGTVIVGKSLGSQGPDVGAEALKAWASASAATGIETKVDELGTWIQFSRPVPKGIDEWSHWEKTPDNNPVSTDSVIKAPYLTQFMANPLYIGMPSITTAAGGRTFLAIGHIAHHQREWDTLNKIIARNGYNGTVLWERKLPEGYLVHRSAFIATADAFHMIDGDSCLLLDPATGKEQSRIRIPDLAGDWKWMASTGGVLYVLAGKPDGGVTTTKGDREFGGWSWADLSKEYYGRQIPVGFGDTLAAYDLASRQPLWLHKEETLIDSRGLAIRDGKVYLYCPDRHLRGLDAVTGAVLWTNAEKPVFNLIEQPGQGLTSTPGWRTQTLVVATPKALIIQGQTRQNVVAISTEDGYLLWTKRKITNNPNAIFVDDNIVLGVGPGGSHVVIDPVSGDVKEDLKFGKTACTRLTACPDSFFVRGEGMLRFDRESKQVLVDGAQRPACNDGAMPAHGLLYLGPWQCDCNLSLIGNIAKCSAGEFAFDYVAKNSERLETIANAGALKPLDVNANDWPTYRGNNQRTSSTKVNVAGAVRERWEYIAERDFTPTAAVAAGGLVLLSGEDGKVRAVDARNGTLRWQFITPGVVKYPPSIWEGRAYVGSGDGHVYCLEAATGRLLWQFRAAPVERHILAYDRISSTWPVGSGVLVEDGVAYFAAGIIDQDGTYVYAVDAKTGQLKWQNNSSGHLSPELRKGVSVQGNLSIYGNQLLFAGGNQVSPAQFDLKTGECLAKTFDQGRPKANSGRYVGVFRNEAVLVGGRILYSAPENVATKGSFSLFSPQGAFQLNYGGVPPAWNDDSVVFVNFKYGKLTCCDADLVSQRITKGGIGQAADRSRFQNLASALEQEGAVRWQTNLDQPNKFEAVSLAVCPNAVVAVIKHQQATRAHPQWYVAAFESKSGKPLFQQELRGEPLPDGLLVDRGGQVVVSMLDGRLLCFGPATGS
jgi:outer membrane protein assembly factor BamB